MSAPLDVIVIGAGPAGSALAAWLARAGRRVALIDQGEFPRQKVCGEYLSPCIWPALEALNVSACIRSLATRMSAFELVLPNECVTEIQFQHDAFDSPMALSRFEFDRALVEHAQAQGANLWTSLRVRKVIVEQGRATGVEVVGVNQRAAARTHFAPLIVGADGRRSAVVRDTGCLVRGSGSTRCGFKGHLRLPGSVLRQLEGRLRMHSLPGGYVGTCLVEDGALNVCGVIPSHWVRDARGAVDRALLQWAKSDPLLTEVLQRGRAEGPWLTMPEVSLQFAKPQCAGVLYVGDAQGTTEPAAGQGMTQAVDGARQLATFVNASGGGLVGTNLQEQIGRAWLKRFGARRRAAMCLGWLLEHPRPSLAAWRAGRMIPGSRRAVVRRAYLASMRGAPSHRAETVRA